MNLLSDSSKPLDLPPRWLPISRLEWALEMVSLLGVILMFVVLVRAWADLPDPIPVHFNAGGAPDRWGGKENLWVLPIVASSLYLLVTVTSRYPRLFNIPFTVAEESVPRVFELARLLLSWLKVEMIWTFCYIHLRRIAIAEGQARGLGRYFLLVSVAVVTVTIIYYLRKMYVAGKPADRATGQ